MSTANLESVAAAAMSEEGGGSSAHSSPGAALLRGPGGHQPVALEREGFFSSGTVTARLESPSFELKPVAATVQSALSAAAAAVSAHAAAACLLVWALPILLAASCQGCQRGCSCIGGAVPMPPSSAAPLHSPRLPAGGARIALAPRPQAEGQRARPRRVAQGAGGRHHCREPAGRGWGGFEARRPGDGARRQRGQRGQRGAAAPAAVGLHGGRRLLSQ